MIDDTFFDTIGSSIPDASKQFFQKNSPLYARIEELLREKNIAQKELANTLGKSPAELNN